MQSAFSDLLVLEHPRYNQYALESLCQHSICSKLNSFITSSVSFSSKFLSVSFFCLNVETLLRTCQDLGEIMSKKHAEEKIENSYV